MSSNNVTPFIDWAFFTIDSESKTELKVFQKDNKTKREKKKEKRVNKKAEKIAMQKSKRAALIEYADKEAAARLCGGISEGLKVENIPRTDISVGSQFPTVQPQPHNNQENKPPHSVLVDLYTARANEVPSPYPKLVVDKWDNSNVRFPWSPESKYPVTIDGRDQLIQRWDVICESLAPLKSLDWWLDSRFLAKQIHSAVMKYNKRFSGDVSWSFKALEELLEDLDEDTEKEMFYSSILPGIVHLCLLGPKAITRSIPLLTANKSQSITMSQHQISVLLANAFFSTFPRRNSTYKKNFEYKTYPDINFNRLFSNNDRRPESQQEKLKTILAYFRRIIEERPSGLVTFTRQSLERDELPNWISDSTLIPGDIIRLNSSGVIEEEGKGMLQVDFANKIVGGGVLGQGLVQEEIRFIICPELIISRLFTEKLEDHEVLFMHGAEQFSKYTGYGDSYRYDGNYNDQTSFDVNRRRNTTIVAMDALSFGNRPQNQYESDELKRELNKAFVGFRPVNNNCSRLNGVATGNWGCGAFRGDPQLKFLIQLLACVVTKRKLCYFTFGDKQLVRTGWSVYKQCFENKLTVSNLFQVIKSYPDRRLSSQTLFQFIEQKLSEKDAGEKTRESADNYHVDTDEELFTEEPESRKKVFEREKSHFQKKPENIEKDSSEADILAEYKVESNDSKEMMDQEDTVDLDKVKPVIEAEAVKPVLELYAVECMEEGRSSLENPRTNGKLPDYSSSVVIHQQTIDIDESSETFTTSSQTLNLQVNSLNHNKKAQKKITDFFGSS